MSKRNLADLPTRPAPKRCKATTQNESTNEAVHDSNSIEQEAEEYLLITAEIPIAALTCIWEAGQSRSLDTRDVASLCSQFRIDRLAPENHLIVSCASSSVQKMKEYLESSGSPVNKETIPSFDAWLQVNTEKLEVLSGQHRITALEQHINSTKVPKTELWWTCKVYDKDRLPFRLASELKFNRHDFAFPDRHGALWLQLVLAETKDPRSLDRFAGERLREEIRKILRLGKDTTFPMIRLMTLWNNPHWKAIITLWCRTTMGQQSFKLNTWAWRAGVRIDTYWFSTIKATIEVLSTLPNDVGHAIVIDDWRRLESVQCMKDNGRRESLLRDLFYDSKVAQESHQPPVRRTGFLPTVSDENYRALFEFLVASPTFVFPKTHQILEISKADGVLMAQVMEHVVRWINPAAAVLADRTRSNRPQLWRGLVPELWLLQNEGETRESVNPEEAARVSQELQWEVLEFARRHLKDLRKPTTKAFLDVVPDTDDQQNNHRLYAQRFSDNFWSSLFDLVSSRVPRFEPWWSLPPPSQVATRMTPSELCVAISDCFLPATNQSANLFESAPLYSADTLAAFNSGLQDYIQRFVTTLYPPTVDAQIQPPGTIEAIVTATEQETNISQTESQAMLPVSDESGVDIAIKEEPGISPTEPEDIPYVSNERDVSVLIKQEPGFF